MRRTTTVILVLAVLGGVLVGGAATAAVVENATIAPAQSAANTSGDGDEASTDAQTGSAPGVQPTSSFSAYTTVYNQTIDSVVTVRVRNRIRSGQGSGFVYDQQGHIVTNEHVVGSAEQVLVRFSNGTWREGDVVGTDVYTDLAVIDVENVPDYVEPLPVAARNPVPGQRVAALGSPYGLEGSISSGIVSGVNRSMDTRRGFTIPATVQTDAPINPGNSGGPLVSLDGTVVGVNRAKRGDNIGYAISPQLVRRVVPALIEDGSYEHSFMGVQMTPVTPAVAEAAGLERARGVMVTRIVDDGPADGVLEPARERERVDGQVVPVGGDVILSVAGRPVDSPQSLARVLLLHTRPGDTVPVTVSRDGERQTVQVTLGERPEPR